jgi:integrative and conjugative element protein (TIGR02256 family)
MTENFCVPDDDPGVGQLEPPPEAIIDAEATTVNMDSAKKLPEIQRGRFVDRFVQGSFTQSDRVFILDIALMHIESIVKNHNLLGDIETGGIFLGKKTPEGIVILHATDAGPDADCFHAEFSPDIVYSQKVINRYRQKYDVYYIGSWHRHPGGYSRLSESDVLQLHQIIDDPDMLDEFVSLIVTDVDGINMNFFHINKEKKIREIKIEQITSDDSKLRYLAFQEDQWDTPKKSDLSISCSPRVQLARRVETDSVGIQRQKNFEETHGGFSKEQETIPWYNQKAVRNRLSRELNELERNPSVIDVGEFEPIEEDLILRVTIKSSPPIYFILTEKYPVKPPLPFYKDENGEYQSFNENYFSYWKESSSINLALRNIVASDEFARIRDRKEPLFPSCNSSKHHVAAADRHRTKSERDLDGRGFIRNARDAVHNYVKKR